MNFRASSFCFLGLGLIALGAHAQSEAPAPAAAAEPSPITANISLTSNYKFRGQDQDAIGNNGFYKTNAAKPAIQGGFDYAHESGFYVGNWNSSVNWLAGNAIESDIYGGYKFKAGVFDLDFGVLTYIYPGNRTGNTTELYGAATWSDEAIGAFTVKYSSTVSKDY
ncbi:TorF family putative porin, partial [uncultured Pseudacidovorax sp.]